ncbi:MAG: hypothetical protein ACLFRP_01390 [Puniceicoccaceae bacterium]
MKIRPIIFSAAALALTLPLVAQEQTVEDQLRQALRDVTVQLRQAQTDLAVARAELESAGEENEDLRKRLDKLAKESAAEQKAMQENINNLNAQLDEESAEVTRLADLLEKWKAAYAKMKTVARAEQSLKEDRSEELGTLQSEVGRLKSDNRELFRIGMEILERYENFGLGKALSAREPFTGITKTRLQTLVQDYQDELLDHRIAMDPTEDASGEPTAAEETAGGGGEPTAAEETAGDREEPTGPEGGGGSGGADVPAGGEPEETPAPASSKPKRIFLD